jgi:hypothetical protein
LIIKNYSPSIQSFLIVSNNAKVTKPNPDKPKKTPKLPEMIVCCSDWGCVDEDTYDDLMIFAGKI